MRKTRVSGRILMTAALVTVLAACSKESTNEPKTPAPPALPPAASMALDLHAFAPEGGSPKIETKLNFWNAQIRAAFLNLVVAGIVTPPSLAIGAATHSIPSPQSDGSWIWTFTFVQDTEELTLQLHGLPQADGVHWQMFVTALSNDPPLDHALWFEGVTATRTEGDWTLYDIAKPEHPAALHVEWQFAPHDDRFLTFTCLDPASNEYEDSLHYSVVDVTDTIMYHDASQSTDMEIIWNEETGAGSLRAPDYKSGALSCWNEIHDDIVCPE